MKDIAPLITQLTTPVTSENEAACEAAAIALGKKGDIALPFIEKLLNVGDIDIRFWMIRALWANGGQAAQETLTTLLSDEDDMIRSGAAMALGELKVISALPALMNLMLEDQGLPGDHAADALGKIGQSAAQNLIQALGDGRAMIRIRAVKALGPIESQVAIPALIQCLDHDESYLVRHYADRALKRMGVGEMIYFKPSG